MSNKARFIDARRRGFLKGAAAAGAASATGSATAGATLAAEVPVVAVPESKGYRLTDHVRTYYDRARF